VHPTPKPFALSDSDATITGDRPAGQPQRLCEVAIGAEVGRYRLLSLLGRGGGGEVFEAEDPDLDRRVALKLIRIDEGAGRAAARLVREAKVLAQLSHPNVVTVLDVGYQDDYVFIAMELVEGVSLESWVLHGERSSEEIVDVYIQAAEGLQAAHDLGLVHRDFKPANAMIDSDGRVRVVDFGLASASEETEVSGPHSASENLEDSFGGRLTQTGDMVGTPHFMAPEQFRRGQVTPATDQFDWCLSLYEALYLRSPFSGDSIADRCRSVLQDEPAPPPSKHPHPPHLWRVLKRGLASDPEDRWPSMASAVAALTKRRRPRRMMAFGVGLALVGGLAATPSVKGMDRAEVEVRASEAPADERPSRLLPQAGALREAINAEAPEDVLAQAEEIFARAEESQDVDAMIECLWVKALAQQRLGGQASTEPIHQRLFSLASEHGRDEQVARAAIELAEIRIEASDRDGAEQFERYAESALERATDAPAWIAADLDVVRARRAESDEDWSRAEEFLRQALKVLEPFPEQSVRVGEVRRGLASLYLKSRRFEEALALNEAEADAIANAFGPDDARTLRARVNVAALKLTLGDFDGAYAIMRPACDALMRSREWMDEDGPCAYNLALIELRLGDYKAARTRLEAEIDRREAAARDDDVTMAKLHRELGTALGRMNDKDAAVAAHERARTLFETALGADHGKTLQAMVILAKAKHEAGDDVGARALLRKSLAALDQPRASPGLQRWATYQLATLVDDSEAIALLQPIVADPTAVEQDPFIASKSCLELARRLFGRGNRERARELGRRARAALEGVGDNQFRREDVLAEITAWQREHDPGA
jgi:tetratricopeptide (TPR) repeat protein